MDYRSPLQHLLHKLLPSLGQADRAAPATDFADTCPDEDRAPPPLRRPATAARPLDAWSRSQTSLDLELGAEIVEFPDDSSADLMDEFFAGSAKRTN